MNEIETLAAPTSSKTAQLIDRNLTKLTATLEGISDGVARAGAEGDVPPKFANMAVKQIESLSGRIQLIDGERIIARSKDTVGRHPVALTVVGAVFGIVVAQLAVAGVRSERRQLSREYSGSSSTVRT